VACGRAQRNILWSNGQRSVGKKKQGGGMGIFNLHDMNVALLGVVQFQKSLLVQSMEKSNSSKV
jgi:hypothetical protein